MADINQTHPREREVYLDAAAIGDPAALGAFLDEACRDDSHLRARVEALLGMESDPSLLRTEPMDREVMQELIEELTPPKRSTRSSGPGAWDPPSPEELAPLFDGYQLTGLVGRGGMGAVYRGIQKSLERPVAIKILPPEFGEDPDFAERFRREALAMGKLTHPNIVTVHDFGRAGPYFYIVMEFVEGADLHRLISRGELPSDSALMIVAQICEAVQYAHERGYVHRDIKPANIFVSSEGHVKVGDFGLAKLTMDEAEEDLPQLTRTGYLFGTPQYMAPENLKPTVKVDHRADIYSLGVMFYEMLTGSIPQGVFDPPSGKVKGVDGRLDEVVLKAMHEDPERRYQQASEVKTALESISGRQVSNEPAPKKNLAPVWALTGSVLVALAVWGWMGWKSSLDDHSMVQRSKTGDAAAPRIGQEFTTTTLVTRANPGSFAMADGCPALSYRELDRAIKFIRANDPDGETWGEPVTIDNQTGSEYSTLTIVGGFPAMAYLDDDSRSLNYVIAKDPKGREWGKPLRVDEGICIGDTAPIELLEIGGRPIIAGRGVDKRLHAFVAEDPRGLGTWKHTVIARDTEVRFTYQMTEVDGRPVIAFPTSKKQILFAVLSNGGWEVKETGIKGSGVQLTVARGKPLIVSWDRMGQRGYVSSDSIGTSWSPLPFEPSFDPGYTISLEQSNGSAAISYWSKSGGFHCAMTQDILGGKWIHQPVDLSTTIDRGRLESAMGFAGDRLMIGYHVPETGELRLARKAIHSSEEMQPKEGAFSNGLPDFELITVDENGEKPSIALIEGHPAISYFDRKTGALEFVRAGDAEGKLWGDPIVVDGGQAPTGLFSSMAVIDGRPAISYHAIRTQTMKYVISKDSLGVDWETPVSFPGQGGVNTSLRVVDGRPAILDRGDGSGVRFSIAHSPDGLGEWSSKKIAPEIEVGVSLSMVVLEGRPAIAFNTSHSQGGKVYYAIADEVTGENWSLRQVASQAPRFSMAVVDGRPAMLLGGFQPPRYLIASDIDGKEWEISRVVDDSVSASATTGLIQFGQSVGAVYTKNQSELYFAASSDFRGLSWSKFSLDDGLSDPRIPLPVMVRAAEQPLIAYQHPTSGELKVAIPKKTSHSTGITIANEKRGTRNEKIFTKDEPIDLLAAIDLESDILPGSKWEKTSGGITQIEGRPGIVVPPIAVLGDYELELRLIPRSGHMAITFPVGTATTTFIPNLNRAPTFGGIEYIRTMDISDRNNPTRFSPTPIRNNVEATLLLRVTERPEGNWSIEVFHDGAPLTSWTGNPTELTPGKNWAIPDSDRIGLGSWVARGGSTYVSATLTPLHAR